MLRSCGASEPLCGLLFSQEYVSLSFSGDGKTLIAQGGAPEWNLVLWVWEKSKVGSVVKTTNQQGVPMFGVSRWEGRGSGAAAPPHHGLPQGVSSWRERNALDYRGTDQSSGNGPQHPPHTITLPRRACTLSSSTGIPTAVAPAAAPPLPLQCAFSPGDSALVSVIGQGIFKLFRNADAGLKAVNPVMGKRDPGLASCQVRAAEGGACLKS